MPAARPALRLSRLLDRSGAEDGLQGPLPGPRTPRSRRLGGAGRHRLTGQRSRSGRLVQGRADIERRCPAQIAWLAFVVRPAAMHRVAIVPDDQIALAPFVAVDEASLRRMLLQVAEQQPPFGNRPADDVRPMRRQVQTLAARARVPAYQLLP